MKTTKSWSGILPEESVIWALNRARYNAIGKTILSRWATDPLVYLGTLHLSVQFRDLSP